MDQRDARGNTALHYAFMTNQEDIVATLLAAGCAAQIVNHDGETPLMMATRNGTTAIVSPVVTAITQNPMEAISGSIETILMLPSILESSQIPQSIEQWRRTAEDGEIPPLGMLLLPIGTRWPPNL